VRAVRRPARPQRPPARQWSLGGLRVLIKFADGSIMMAGALQSHTRGQSREARFNLAAAKSISGAILGWAAPAAASCLSA